ncbi:MAG: hypothetical protein A2948_03015 [Candidatus Lloydbacteria bacterium RIFCSPLOWO2_01_FULL_54_18]|nr:MAG: hypothetical protein A2948_03015 [Candidatus Lloydbacteria bacterium RIFCSPLOWO2_01_FULL_54_18]
MLLLGGGVASNALVMHANDGKMPVAVKKEDMLFVIGPARFGVNYFATAEHLGEQHQVLTEETRFRILADRIPISFAFIRREELPSWCNRALEFIKIPPGDEGIASIGDLLIWPGILFALFTIPSLLVLLVLTLARRFSRRE